MNNWEMLFSRQILQRGKEYFRRKKVRLVREAKNKYYAEVEGNDIYFVDIEFLKNDNIRMQCDCPYAESGMRCKHMAAVLYAIDSEEADSMQISLFEKETKKIITPFSEKKENVYSFFDISRFDDKFIIYEDVYNNALKLIERPGMILSDIKVKFSRLYTGEGQLMHAEFVFNEKKRACVKILFSTDELLEIKCGCDKKVSYSTEYSFYFKQPKKIILCEHVTAAFIILKDYIEKNNPGDITDRYALSMFDAFRKLRTKDGAENSNIPARNVHLEPRIENKYGKLILSFKIGCERRFVVRNLTDLVCYVNEKKSMMLGKSDVINFAVDEFSEESKKIYRFISRCVNEENLRMSNINYSYSPYKKANEIVSGIELFGIRLDEFFELFENKMIPYTKSGSSGKEETLTPTFGTLKPNISIESITDEKTNAFIGISLKSKTPEIIEGSGYSYYISAGRLYRIDIENYEKVKPVFENISSGRENLSIGLKNLSEFYYSIFPELKKIANIKESDTELIREHLPPEATFIFYLDCKEGKPLCKVKVQYGDMQYLLGHTLNNAGDYRDSYREAEVVGMVRKYFPIINESDDCFMCDESDDRVYTLLKEGIADFLAAGDVNYTDAFNSLRIHRKIKINVGVSIKNNLMELKIQNDEIPEEELIEILESYRQKKTYHRLKNGDFISLDSSITEFDSLIGSLDISSKALLKEKIHIPVYRALYLDKILEKYENIYSDRDKKYKKLIKDFKTVNESDFEIPQTLEKVMRDYQKFGHKWLRTLSECGFGGILADDMGLGKTLQTISVLLSSKENNNNETSIVICPASLVYNWQEEFLKFAPSLNAVVVAGMAEERREIIKNYRDYDVIITSYDLLKRDIADYENASFEYQILDEAQNIKNHFTIAAKSVKSINSKIRFALTGTPIENRLSELWSIFDYLMPGFLYKYEVFKKNIESPIVKNQDEEASKRLKFMVAPFILRRLKNDVLKDLPEKIEEVRYTRLLPEQRKIYDGQALKIKELINSQNDDAFQKGKLQILAELTRIRQICCDPSLIFEDYDSGSAKREACVDLILSAVSAKHKILVFSQFTSMLSLLEKDLKDNGLEYYKITGETDKKKRLMYVEKFNNDDTPVFLISLKAGGTGLNLTGADVVIHFDPWWNVAAQNQATDRAHRIGQNKVVSVYKLIAKDTVEEKIEIMQDKKKELADAIISENAVMLSSMSKDDILKILQ